MRDPRLRIRLLTNDLHRQPVQPLLHIVLIEFIPLLLRLSLTKYLLTINSAENTPVYHILT